MGCCRKIRYRSQERAVLCVKWVLPIRILALSSIIIHIGIILLHKGNHPFILPVTALIHLAVVFGLLKECQISVKYHTFLQHKKYK